LRRACEDGRLASSGCAGKGPAQPTPSGAAVALAQRDVAVCPALVLQPAVPFRRRPGAHLVRVSGAGVHDAHHVAAVAGVGNPALEQFAGDLLVVVVAGVTQSVHAAPPGELPRAVLGLAGPISEPGTTVKAVERRAAAKPRQGVWGPCPHGAAPKGRASAAAKLGACLDGAKRWTRACYEQTIRAPAGPPGPNCGRHRDSLRGGKARESKKLDKPEPLSRRAVKADPPRPDRCPARRQGWGPTRKGAGADAPAPLDVLVGSLRPGGSLLLEFVCVAVGAVDVGLLASLSLLRPLAAALGVLFGDVSRPGELGLLELAALVAGSVEEREVRCHLGRSPRPVGRRHPLLCKAEGEGKGDPDERGVALRRLGAELADGAGTVVVVGGVGGLEPQQVARQLGGRLVG